MGTPVGLERLPTTCKMQSFYRLILKLNSKTEIHSGGYIYNLENGYPKYAAGYLKKYSDIDFEFIDFGISGNRTKLLKYPHTRHPYLKKPAI